MRVNNHSSRTMLKFIFGESSLLVDGWILKYVPCPGRALFRLPVVFRYLYYSLVFIAPISAIPFVGFKALGEVKGMYYSWELWQESIVHHSLAAKVSEIILSDM